MAGDAPVPDARASDAERELAIGRLKGAAAEGRLTFEELADRVEAAAGAVTHRDLEQVTQDLPPGAPAAPARASDAPPTRASKVFADVRRSGAWAVPAAGKWETLFGDVVLDVREARVTAPEMRINAGTVFGDVELLVPEGVEVEIRARTLLGNIEQEAGEVAPHGAPRIVLTGGTVFGDVRVRAQRMRSRLAERLDERLRRRGDLPAG
jgi:Domain of unknown function (DUF1707)/Cell wall-active antibiotics response 4TMS YvqF